VDTGTKYLSSSFERSGSSTAQTAVKPRRWDSRPYFPAPGLPSRWLNRPTHEKEPGPLRNRVLPTRTRKRSSTPVRWGAKVEATAEASTDSTSYCQQRTPVPRAPSTGIQEAAKQVCGNRLSGSPKASPQHAATGSKSSLSSPIDVRTRPLTTRSAAKRSDVECAAAEYSARGKWL
jgi:hypothetical protein